MSKNAKKVVIGRYLTVIEVIFFIFVMSYADSELREYWFGFGVFVSSMILASTSVALQVRRELV